MKNLFILLLFFSASTYLSAQSKSYIIGGNFNFNSQKNNPPLGFYSYLGNNGYYYNNYGNSDRIYSSFSFNPYIGKNINDKWTIGTYIQTRFSSLTYSYTSLINSSFMTINTENKTVSLGISLFGRYNINPSNNLIFFLEPHIGIITLNEENKDIDINNVNISTTKYKAKNINIGVNIGAKYIVSSKVNILANLGGINYNTGDWESANISQKNSNFGSLNADFNLSNIFFGFEYKF
jgi:hypothetical protein